MPKKDKRVPSNTVVTRDYTINLHKRLYKTSFKKRAPKAVSQIQKFAQAAMRTKDVRIDVRLNQFVWSKGIRNPPNRVRVRLSRKKNEDEDAEEKMYTLVSWVPVDEYKGLVTQVVED
eukprot:TRINITY_DN549_c0_g1_i2.p1 TRINITY_DN549_c0_g1~~TRINITY_DN549_c0_g1_i2.p1  ORF type:complete len:118 (-),score=21.67 TRINITY_DN549_c0_g1_i2:88-441(-)